MKPQLHSFHFIAALLLLNFFTSEAQLPLLQPSWTPLTGVGAYSGNVVHGGNVGIGTVVPPTAKLEVNGTLLVSGGVNFNGYLFQTSLNTYVHTLGDATLEGSKVEVGKNTWFHALGDANFSGSKAEVDKLTWFHAKGDATFDSKLESTGPNAYVWIHPTTVHPLLIGDRWTFHNGVDKYMGYNVQWIGSANQRVVDGYASRITLTKSGNIDFWTAPEDKLAAPLDEHLMLSIRNDGKVVIGKDAGLMASPNEYRLFVDKGILTEKVKVALRAGDWSDFVFDSCYQLMPLTEVAAFVSEKKHLPNVPSAAEVEQNGVDLGQMNSILLRKIEELTLQMIALDRQNIAIQAQLSTLTTKK